jgi:predicted Fe-Mo cluster-binding NifX family protein
MKIALSVYTSNNSAKISPSFGKSNYYLIYDLNKEILLEKLNNHFSSSAGSEVFLAQLLIKRGVNIIVCGSCEEDANNLFSEANIQVIENVNINPGVFLNDFYKRYRSNKSIAEFSLGLT